MRLSDHSLCIPDHNELSAIVAALPRAAVEGFHATVLPEPDGCVCARVEHRRTGKVYTLTRFRIKTQWDSAHNWVAYSEDGDGAVAMDPNLAWVMGLIRLHAENEVEVTHDAARG